MKIHPFLILFFFLNTISYAQNSISTDRPSVGFNSYIVPKKSLTGELGFFFSHDKVSLNKTENLVVNSMFRYGITSRFEVRAGIDYQSTTVKNDRTGKTMADAMSPLNLGFKALLFESESANTFRIALLAIVGLPFTVKEELRPDNPPIYSIFIAEKYINSKASIYLDHGGNWANDTWLWNTNLGYSHTVSPQFNYFGEVYSFYNTDAFSFGIDAGIGIVIADKYQVDAALGYGLNDSATDLLLNLGFSFLID